MIRLALPITLLLLAGSLALASAGAAAAPAAGEPMLVRIWLRDSLSDLGRLAAEAGVTAVAHEALPEPYVLALADEATSARLKAGGFAVEIVDDDASAALYCLADAQARPDARLASGQVLFDDGVRRLVRLPSDAAAQGCGLTAWPLGQPVALLPRSAPQFPQVITPLPQVQDIIDQVYLPRIMDYAEDLSGEQIAIVGGDPYLITTRYTYSGQPVQKAVQYMVEHLERLGLNVTLQLWNPSYPPNVIAEKPGLTQPANIYIIGAHLDSTSGSAMTSAPGADDNASGSVAVLTAAELLAPYNFDATVRFVLFTGEEQGLWGSQAYVASLSGQNILGMLNLDMVSWDNVGGPLMDVHAKSTVAGSVALGNLFNDVVSAYSLDLTPTVYSNGTGASDHASFWNAGYAAILAIEDYYYSPNNDFNAYYHTINDRTIYYNQPYYGEMVKASLATMAHLAGLRTDCNWADLDCSCEVNVVDIETAAARWGAAWGDWRYHRVYDVDHNNVIDVLDLQQYAAQWGWACSQ